jgi:predicted molibdopterin-dependent oxidoreductase YjgC
VKWEDAIRAIDVNLKDCLEAFGANAILGFASASSTNEALFLFKEYLGQHLGATNLEFRLNHEDQKVTEKEDEILRHTDKRPNSMGAIKLGLLSGELGGIDGAIEAARAGRLKAGVITYYRPLVRRPEDEQVEAKVAELIKALEYSVVFAAHKADWLAEANVVLPVAAWSEDEGTYTNYQGRVQKVSRAIRPKGDTLPLWEVFAMLLEASGSKRLWLSAQDVFAGMTENIPAYQGIALEQTRLPGTLATA